MTATIDPAQATGSAAIEDIVVDKSIQIRHSEHRETVRRYQEALEQLPPVLLVRLDDGRLMLTDGFHRYWAFKRSGKTEIPARVIDGTLTDVYELAVTENTRNADPLAPDERDKGILRLKLLHPDWTLRQIAEAMSVGHNTVKRVLDAAEVSGTAGAERLPQAVLVAIASAPLERREQLTKAAVERDWSAQAARDAARDMADPELREDEREEIAAGRADPRPAYDADHAERLDVARARVTITYMIPSGKTRTRAGRTYSKERVQAQRIIDVNLGTDAMDPKEGPLTIAKSIGNRVYHELKNDGWPVRFEDR